jgi:glycerophosphoryl diester phosphodiesterase
MIPLDPRFLSLPLAHRGLHDRAQDRPENSRAAMRAAIAGGYGIELDLQPSADGVPMVFHDYRLGRLTGQEGAIRQHDAATLGQIALNGGDEGIPTLAEILALVAGRVPLLIEVKDQDGAMGPDVGPLEAAAVAALQNYAGPVALMSFNPHSVAALRRAGARCPVGLITAGYAPEDWPLLPEARRAELRGMAGIDALAPDFLSHEAADLGRPELAAQKARGLPVLCWTIRSPAAEAVARRVADNITFEGYAAALPGAAA